ncbi:MAG: serine protease [Clostridiales bacterium]|jgi:serine protease inhibitor|nr:serine protease [Clostridiales bacterium]HHT54026.1 serine protease [Clostridiales bacterium]
MKMAKMKLRLVSCLLVLSALATNLVSCALKISAQDLMEGINPRGVEGRAPGEEFYLHSAELAINLFKKTTDENKNSLISPLSVVLALAMTANGADTGTLEQMQAYLGGNIPLSEFNEYLYYYYTNLPSAEKSKLGIANSIWFRDDENRLTVNKEFLQTNADYYKASIYKSDFGEKTLEDINKWVSDKTDGMIDKILDEIDEDTVMYLINALVFDARWQRVYNKNDIYDGRFTDISGQEQTVDFMFSEESLYLDDGRATGFIKPYEGSSYSFVALLPNEDVPINEYINSLTGEGFVNTVKSAENTLVNASLPKFSYDSTVKMNDALKELGIPKAFSANQADFSNLGKSSRGNIYIGEVLHKTFISVDELGTRAGAVTKVEMKDEAYFEAKIVKLDRPFVYAIIDNASGLPVFIGAVMSIEG